MDYEWITSDPDVLGGKPVIRGTRISVELILEWLADGANIDAVVASYPQLPRAAVVQALQYAAHQLQDDRFVETGMTA